MSDQDFNFRPPPRRERKEFEPPPWEKDQYGEVSREQAVHQEVAEDESAASDRVVGSASADEALVGMEPKRVPVEKKSPPKDGVDDHRVAAMLFELMAQEEPATRSMNRAALIAGSVLTLIGAVLCIWGIAMIVVASQRPEQGKGGVVVGLMILMFGAGFAGIGAWFVYRTLRQQGVL